MTTPTPNFDISVPPSEQHYWTEVGSAAALRVEAGASVDCLRGSILGSGNTIRVSQHARVHDLRLTIRGDGNSVHIGRNAHLVGNVIAIDGNTDYGDFRGHHNRLDVGLGTELLDAHIDFKGTNNVLAIGDRVHAAQRCEFYCRGFGCSINIGHRTSLTNAYLHAEEIETTIEIGPDNMIAPYVAASTGDKHPIYRIDTLKRANAARNIATGEHVWLASGVQLLKGARVGNHCVVAIHTSIHGPVLLPDSQELAHHAVIRGVPATAQKTGVSWSRQMFYDERDEWARSYPDAAAQSCCHRGHLLVSEGAKHLAQGLLADAESMFNEGVENYKRATTYKPDYVYAHAACGVAHTRLAEVAFSQSNFGAAVDALRAAIQSFESALSFEPGHNDSQLDRGDAMRTMDALLDVQTTDPDSDTRSKILVRAHLGLFSFEWRLPNRDLAKKHFREAAAALGNPSEYDKETADLLSELEMAKTLLESGG